MSRDQATNKARAWTRIAQCRQSDISYRAEEWYNKEHAVIQYYGERPVGIAAS